MFVRHHDKTSCVATARRRKLLAAAFAAFMPPAIAGADTLMWDSNGAALPNPSGGSGTWSSSSVNWWNGVFVQGYNVGAAPHDDVFNTAAGTVTVSGTVSARSLSFETTGYSLTGGTVSLSNPATISVADSSASATISSILSGASISKTGSGRLILSGANTYSGLNITSGAVSFSADNHLGAPTAPLYISNASLQFTGATSVTSARNVAIGAGGATFDIANTSSSGLTIGGVLSGIGALVKNGSGTMRLDDANHLFGGGITINQGTFRFNNNNSAGPKALRMNRVSFGAAGATLSLGGSGGSTTGEGSELRSGEWNSAGPGAGAIVAATTTTDTAIGANGHDLMIFALADATFSGTVNNTITASGGAAGATSTHGEFDVRGIARQTLSGVTNINNTIGVGHNAGLVLAGSTALTGSGVSLQLKGGSLSLNNSSVNNADRFNDAGMIDVRGGGSIALVGNSSGSTETLGQLQLGAATVARSGQVNVQVIAAPGSTVANVLTLASLQRDSGRATVDFSASVPNVVSAGSTPLPLGQAGANPRIVFSSAPALASGSGLLSAGGVGSATVNGTDFATYGANGIAPVTTMDFASSGSTSNASLGVSTTISSTKTVASLKIAPPSSGMSLTMTGSANLDTSAILHTGPFSYTIASTGTGGLTGTTPRHVFVQQGSLTISAKVTGAAPLVKSGDGTLILTGANTYTGVTTLNAGNLRATNGTSLGPGTLEMRGGVLELTGGTFNRHLDQGQGSAGTPGLISWNAIGPALGQTSDTDRGGGGFAAVGSNSVVDLNGLGASDITWEEPSFIPSGYALLLGSRNASARIELIDNYGFGLGTSAYNTREFRVIDNPNSTADLARISGIIYSDTPANGGQLHDLLKSGEGTLELTGANTYYGGTIIAEGTLIAGNSNALGDASGPYVFVGNRGGIASAGLLANASVNLARDITIQSGSTGTHTLGAATSGNATFSGNILLRKSVTLTAPAAATVSFTGVIDNPAGSSITKTGTGTARVRGLRNGSLTISAGTIQVIPDGGVSGVCVIDSLSLAAGTTLDLADNDLVVNNGNFATIRASVLQGFGNPAGPGITSSTSNGSQILALFSNTLVGKTEWQGLSIGPNAVVGQYTFFGDLNLDGQVTGDDYTVVDANLNTTPPAGLAWLSGDANMDGVVTGDDYTTIDSNLGSGAGNPLAPSSLPAVPEPISIIMLAAALLPRRRRDHSSRDRDNAIPPRIAGSPSEV